MEKKARNRAKNPEQEALRQYKSQWNKEVSHFISNLIEFKKATNGLPSKFNAQKTRITSPLPSDFSSILNQLAGVFQEITSKGNDVLNKQLEYSTKFQDQKLKKLDQLTPKVSMVVEGTNALTRFWSKVKYPLMGTKEEKAQHKFRMSAISGLLRCIEGLKKLQELIVFIPGKDKNLTIQNVREMKIILSGMIRTLQLIEGSFKSNNLLNPPTVEVKQESEKPKEETKPKEVSKLQEVSDDMNKLASNFLSKWWKEKKLNWSSESSSALRISLNNEMKDLRVNFDNLIDSLESGLNPDYFLSEIKNILSVLTSFKEKIALLDEFDDDAEKRMMKLLFNKKVKDSL